MVSYGWNAFLLTNSSTACAAYIEIRGLTLRGISYVDTNGDRQFPAQYLSTIGQVTGVSNGNGINIEGRSFEPKPRHFRFADNLIEYFPGGGIGVHASDRVAIQDNVIHSNCWWSVYGNSGIATLVSVDTETTGNIYRKLISGNVLYNNHGMVPCRGSNNNFTDANGIIIDNDWPSSTARTLIQNNLSVRNGGAGIQVFKSQRADIIHNTAYGNSYCPRLAWGQLHMATFADVRAYNNIFVALPNLSGSSTFNKAPVVGNTSTLYLHNNIYWGGENNSPTGANHVDNLKADPRFLSGSANPETFDFRLRSNSPAIAKGKAVGFRATRDFDGLPRTLSGATNSGAYELDPGRAFSPVFSPQPGNFTVAQSVTLSADTAGATIIYTTDGSVPAVDEAGAVTNGSVYSGAAIPVSVETLLRAIAWKSGLAPSRVSTARYTFQTTFAPVSTPTYYLYTDKTNFFSTTGGVLDRTLYHRWQRAQPHQRYGRRQGRHSHFGQGEL
jgi:hypothetical protein